MVEKRSMATRDVRAQQWIATYDDLDDYIAECQDDDRLWLLARAMSDDALASGYGHIDVGAILEGLVLRRVMPRQGFGGDDDPPHSVFEYEHELWPTIQHLLKVLLDLRIRCFCVRIIGISFVSKIDRDAPEVNQHVCPTQ